MWNVACPACGKTAFGWLAKVLLGPARTVHCGSCGVIVGLSPLPLVVGVALFIAFVLVSGMPDSPFADGRKAIAVFSVVVLGWGLWFVRSSPVLKPDDGDETDDEGEKKA
jgi:hypothetical protein